MGNRTKSAASASSSVRDASAMASPPDWPPLRPLVPASDLCLETLAADQIVLIRNLLTPTLCKSLVSFMSTLPMQTTPGIPKKGDATRISDRYLVQDPEFARTLWESTALRDLICGTEQRYDDDAMTVDERKKLWGGTVLGLNPSVRIYRYSAGQFFAPHYDVTNTLAFPSRPPSTSTTPAKTTWTLLIYLTSSTTGCVGGETVFYPAAGAALAAPRKSDSRQRAARDPIVVELETGMALLHRHGPECMLHEGGTVECGEKWVLRSDLCVERGGMRA